MILNLQQIAQKKRESVELSLGAAALITGLALVFETFSEHFHLFFNLSLTSGAAFAFIVATFFARRLPALKHSSHCSWDEFMNYYILIVTNLMVVTIATCSTWRAFDRLR